MRRFWCWRSSRRQPLRAQDPDIIRGRVTGPDSLPIEGASVSVTAIASGVNKTARTDKDGRFTITFPSAEGDYWVMIQHIGLAARRFEIKRLADEDVLIADTRLSETDDDPRPVRVQGQRPTAQRDNGNAVDVSGNRTARQHGRASILSTLGDLAALAARSRA